MTNGSMKRQLAVVAASVAGAAGLLVAGPAGATADERPNSFTEVSAMAGVCGWFGQEFPDRFETVNVCGYDGVDVADGELQGDPARPLVIIDRYVCSLHVGRDCEAEHHELTVDPGDLVIDPLLRQARITTTGAVCAVEVEFAGLSATTPGGNVWEQHGLEGGPWMFAGVEETVSRPAQWWGHVCGRFLVSGSGEGRMWRSLAASGGRSVPGERHLAGT